MKRAINRIIQLPKNIFTWLLFGLFSICVFMLLGFLALVFYDVAMKYKATWVIIITIVFAESFFIAMMYLYNYSKQSNRRLSDGLIASLGAIKLFTLASVLTIPIQKLLKFGGNLLSLFVFGAIVFFVFAILFIGVEFLGDSDYFSQENTKLPPEIEVPNFKRQYQKLSNQQEEEIEKIIKSKVSALRKKSNNQ